MLTKSNRSPDPGQINALLQSAKRGERSAHDLLQKQLLPLVERFVLRLIGPREEVKDIVREASLALYLSLYRFSEPDSLLPFLYRVARNKAYDVLRLQGRFDHVDSAPVTGEESPLERFADPASGPEDSTLRWILWQEVQQAMERLPEAQRQTLILYAEEDFTYQQIAEATATDPGTVRSRLFHARRNLIRHLRPDTREALGLTDR